MEIRINGKKADITLENEKTIGEVLSSLESWLSGSSHHLSGIYIDDRYILPSQMEEVFSKEVTGVKILDLKTSTAAELAAESLVNALANIKEYESLNYEEKPLFLEKWKQSAAAAFIQNNYADLYGVLSGAFSGGLPAKDATSITEERLREVQDPALELEKLKPLLDEVCSRLCELSLDIQTGKDLRAAQTIQLFSGVGEKILRVANQLVTQGLTTKTIDQLFGNFKDLIKDLLDAYERHDSVLVGDLAEYEASPKLQELYSAIKV